jgi:5-methylcytosine-specific restriction endonuclease McrA
MKKQVELRRTGVVFGTQKEAREYVRSRLRHPTDIQIHSDNPLYTMMIDLIDRHSHYSGIRPDYFSVYRQGPGLQKVSFTKGVEENVFSVNKCITQLEKSDTHQIHQYMRCCIENQVTPYRDHNCNKCGYTGYVEVDHVRAFADIQAEFIAIHGKPIASNIKHRHVGVARPVFEYNDDNYTRKWQQYHQDNCELQALCKDCHKRKTYRWDEARVS